MYRHDTESEGEEIEEKEEEFESKEAREMKEEARKALGITEAEPRRELQQDEDEDLQVVRKKDQPEAPAGGLTTAIEFKLEVEISILNSNLY